MSKDQVLLNVVVNQRNAAHNECATLAAELAIARERIKELEAKVPKRKKKNNAPSEPRP